MKQEIDQKAGYQTGPRIRKFLEYKGEKIAVFSKKTGIDRSLITRSFNQTRDFGVTSLQKIGNSYPELSLNWVITGEGEMILPDLNDAKYFTSQYNSIEEDEDKKWFWVQTFTLGVELSEMKILEGRFEQVFANEMDGKYKEDLKLFQEKLLWLQFKRREAIKKSRDAQREINISSMKNDLNQIDELDLLQRTTETIHNFIKSIQIDMNEQSTTRKD